MQDRIPVNPGRVLITPENGSAAYYATMTRADNATQEGTPLNKNSLLRDATASLFGLGADAVPDDVFGFLGEYAKHWWSVTATEKTAIQTVETPTRGSLMGDGIGTSSQTETFTIEYADSVNYDIDTRVVSLVNAKTLTLSYNTYTTANTLKGKYFVRPSTGYIYYISPSAPDATHTDPLMKHQIIMEFGYVAYTVVESNDVSYVNSSDRNAYPDSGTVDGIQYRYLGIPFQNAVTAPAIATGSYTGTGTYGASNPNSLTFDFEPKVWGFYGYHNIANTNFKGLGLKLFPWGVAGTTYTWNLFGSTSDQAIETSYYGNTVSWYSSVDRAKQFNEADLQYYYIAIG